jgi:hypothetical protein
MQPGAAGRVISASAEAVARPAWCLVSDEHGAGKPGLPPSLPIHIINGGSARETCSAEKGVVGLMYCSVVITVYQGLLCTLAPVFLLSAAAVCYLVGA